MLVRGWRGQGPAEDTRTGRHGGEETWMESRQKRSADGWVWFGEVQADWLSCRIVTSKLRAAS